jgi:hypothetical protein
MIYLDGCYVAKFYLAEPDSPAVIQCLQEEGEAGSLAVAKVEVMMTFHRKLREGVMNAAEFKLLTAQFEEDCQAGLWTWWPLSDEIIQMAHSMIRTLPASVFLRTGDALHLAGAVLNGFQEVHTSDRHMLTASAHVGLIGVKL